MDAARAAKAETSRHKSLQMQRDNQNAAFQRFGASITGSLPHICPNCRKLKQFLPQENTNGRSFSASIARATICCGRSMS
jgi:hypothetical protein